MNGPVARPLLAGLAPRIALLLEHVRTPMYLNAYALILNQFASGALGMVYWLLVARLFDPSVVGQNVALLSTILIMGIIAELSLASAAVRFVPTAGARTPKLVLSMYGVATSAAVLVGFALLASKSWFPIVDHLLENTPVGVGWLVAATISWIIFHMQDGVLLGMRGATWILIENSLFNVLKILLALALWANPGTGGTYPIVLSWFLPVPLLVVLVNFLIFARLMPRHVAAAKTTAGPVSSRQIAKSVAADYAGTSFSEVTGRLLPLFAIQLAGSSASAYFNQAWVVAAFLSLISSALCASFTVEAALDASKMRVYSRRILLHMARLVVPMTVATLIGAPALLSIFGPAYAQEGTSLLRWLALAALPGIINTWYLSFSRLRIDVRSLIFTQGALCVLALGLSSWWLPVYGITSIGVAWFLSQTVVSLAVVAKVAPILFGAATAGWAEQTTIPDQGTTRQASRPEVGPGVPSLALSRATPEHEVVELGRIEPEDTYLLISPHLDDVVLSCGGLVHRAAALGARVIVATVVTADPPRRTHLSWLARRHHRAWRLGDSPFEVRRREDRSAVKALGATYIHLGLQDAVYRRDAAGRPLYHSRVVGVPVHPYDRENYEPLVREKVLDILAANEGRRLRVVCPLSAEWHVDHIVVRHAVESVCEPEDIFYYEDYPYASRPSRAEHPLGPQQDDNCWHPTIVRLSNSELAARIAAIAKYQSQVSGLFPSPSERLLEIGRARFPLVRGVLERAPDVQGSSMRMARTVKAYVDQVGGERYWKRRRCDRVAA